MTLSKSRAKPRVQLVGVSGGSGSGKTTFARDLAAALGPGSCAILSQDHYYIDQSAKFRGDGENVNFDHPEALDFILLAQHLADLKRGLAIQVPIYDFVTHKRLPETEGFSAVSVVILDGTLILSQPNIRQHFDHGVFVDAPENVRFERRLKRDVAERGRTPEGVLKQFNRQVKPMHDQFVEPSKAHATSIISGLDSFDHLIGEWKTRLLQQ
jgi:uridine kinase